MFSLSRFNVELFVLVVVVLIILIFFGGRDDERFVNGLDVGVDKRLRFAMSCVVVVITDCRC